MTDNKFALTAIDWRTVSILHAEHLLLESRYIEELTRWERCMRVRTAESYASEAQDLVVTASTTGLRGARASSPAQSRRKASG
jgi:hypothetical protein